MFFVPRTRATSRQRRPPFFACCQVKSGPAFYKAPGSSLIAVMVSCTTSARTQMRLIVRERCLPHIIAAGERS